MNLVKVTMRHLWKNRSVSVINILGLTIGIAACMILYSIVSYEFNVDDSLPGKERIYRIYSEFSGPFTGINRGVPTGYYNHITENVTGIEAVAHFHGFWGEVTIPMEDGNIKNLGVHNKGLIARPDYFNVFSHYNWLYGDPEQSLGNPNQIVLTQSRADVYFGDIPVEDVIGKEIIYRDSLQFIVSGVIEDVPFNSDLYFTEFLSQRSFITDNENYSNFQENGWNNINSGSQLFVKLFPDTDTKILDSISKELSAGYLERNKESSWTLHARFQKYEDMHFDTETGIFDQSRSVASVSTLGTLGIIAILILLVASINFVNLETAQAGTRSREVGVRKILGSSRSNLISHFLFETFILTLISVVIATIISAISIGAFTEFIPEGLSFSLNATIFTFLIGMLVFIPLISGLYPAILVSAAEPVNALKNQMGNTRNSASVFVRKVLSVFQFTISQVLIVITVVIGLQLSYMLEKDLGFRADDIVYFSTPYYQPSSKKDVILNELRELAFIEKMSLHQSPPSSNSISTSITSFERDGEKVEVDIMRKGADSTYIDFYDIKLLAGKNISSLSKNSYLINETLMREMGFENPEQAVGAKLNDEQVVMGVVKDFHTQSLKSPIMPLAIVPYDVEDLRTIGLKLGSFDDPEKLSEWMSTIESKWDIVYPDNSININFLDETLQQFYQSEVKTSKLAKIATGIAILISCLGLFGLFTFTVIQRTKEIGIRKVLGASSAQILRVLTSNILVLILISLVLSVPIGYYLADMWLKDFTYRIPIHPLIFGLTGLLTALTALVTVGIKSVRAAQKDPIDSLRYE